MTETERENRAAPTELERATIEAVAAVEAGASGASPAPADAVDAPGPSGSARALIVVDVQPTFCEGGALAVEGGNAVAARVAAYAARTRGRYDVVVTTQDWHIDPGAHFSATPDFVDTWPPHGVAGTDEAELHPALADLAPDVQVKKGRYEAAYSGFEGVDVAGRSLAALLAARGVTDVDVVGLAESHCVRQTALDAVGNGLRTRVLTDLTVPVSPEQGEAARAAMAAAGVLLEPCAGGGARRATGWRTRGSRCPR